MKKRFLLILLFGIITIAVFLASAIHTSAAVSHYYKVWIGYEDGNVFLKQVSVEPAQKEIKTSLGSWAAEIISDDNKTLNITSFLIPLTVFYDGVDEKGEISSGGMVKLNKSEATFFAPYFDNAVKIDIYDSTLKRKLSIDVSELAKKPKGLTEPLEEGAEKGKAKEAKYGLEKPEELIGKMPGLLKPKQHYKLMGYAIAVVLLALILLWLLWRALKRKKETSFNL